MRSLLVITAIGEAATGLAAAASPSLVTRLLFAVEVPEGVGIVLSRIAGVALLAIGGACWLARRESNGAALRGLLAGVLIYDFAVAAVLVHAGLVLGMAGVVLWPAVIAHGALAIWCGLCLRSTTRTMRGEP